MGFNFLVGPAEVYVRDSNGATYFAVYYRDESLLHSVLPAGTYTLAFATGIFVQFYNSHKARTYSKHVQPRSNG
jgi:hypothetical protein